MAKCKRRKEVDQEKGRSERNTRTGSWSGGASRAPGSRVVWALRASPDHPARTCQQGSLDRGEIPGARKRGCWVWGPILSWRWMLIAVRHAALDQGRPSLALERSIGTTRPLGYEAAGGLLQISLCVDALTLKDPGARHVGRDLTGLGGGPLSLLVIAVDGQLEG